MTIVTTQKNSSSIPHEDVALKKIESSHIKEHTMLFMGPIPPPSVLKEYEQLLPGAANRILEMAENQVKHRHEIENKQINIEISQNQSNIELAKKEMSERKRGQLCAFTITLSTLFCGAVLSYLNKPLAGTLFGGAGLASVLLVFYSKNIPWPKKKNNHPNNRKSS